MAELEPQVIVQNLPITSTAIVSLSKGLPGSVVSILPIQQTVSAVIVPGPNKLVVQSDVVVNQVITFEKIKSIQSTGVITQSISRQIERVRTLTSVVEFRQYVIAYIDKGVSGNDGQVYVDPIIKAYEDSLVRPAQITLDCNNPDVGINETITLRKPDFGDQVNLSAFRIERQTLGGDLQIYKDSMWPDTEKIDLAFSYLNEEDATDLLMFLGKTLGQKINYHDHFGNDLVGFIITPFEQILQPKVNGWSASFTFQIWEEPNET